MDETNDVVIGIDLGTTNSCAAYFIDDKVHILENDEQGRVTPSVVAYIKKDEIVAGKLAKKISSRKPELCVYQIKRLIGRKTNDPFVQANLSYFPFSLDKDSDEPIVVLKEKNETVRKTPVEICTTILKKIKYDVEKKLGVQIRKAVITVPAYFNVTQREATLEAATAAGFTVLKLMNEPTAAALSYYHEREPKNDKYSLVFDFGGGTFDVAILKKRENDIEIVGVDGDTHLGGQDVDNLIIDFVCNKLETDYNSNCRQDKRLMRRLHEICEEAKIELSSRNSTNISLDGFIDNHDDVELEFTRIQLEKLASGLFTRSLHVVSNCLVTSNLKKSDIGDIILSGGTTRIPKLQRMLSEFFDNKPLRKLLNLEECVAEGAALQAAMYSTNPRQKIQNIRITEVASLSLGTALMADVMDFLIKRNTPLPATNCSTVATVNDRQTQMKLKIYEGERLNAKKNRFLGEFTFNNLTPAPPGQCRVTITMCVDTNGILKIEAKEHLKENVKQLQVTYTGGARSDFEVRSAVQDAENNKEEDKKFIKFAAYKIYLIQYCKAVAYNLTAANLKEAYKRLYDSLKLTILEVHEMQMEQEEKLKKIIEIMEQKIQPLIEKHNFQLMPSLENVAKNLNVTQFYEIDHLNGKVIFKELELDK